MTLLLLLVAAAGQPADAPLPGYISQATSPPPAMSIPGPRQSTVIDAVPPGAEPRIIAVPIAAPPPGRLVGDPSPPMPPPPRDVVRDPEPRRPAQSYFNRDDYPPAAIAMHAEGRVDVLLTVGPDGRVLGCNVVASSGSGVLDRTTCNLLRRRARFTPAIDSHGNPTVGTIRQEVEWRL